MKEQFKRHEELRSVCGELEQILKKKMTCIFKLEVTVVIPNV